MIPAQLGPYRIERKIGRGGMGTVYYGIHLESGDEAAVKVLSGNLAAEPGFRARFSSEIETLKKLDHPHIVRLYGYGDQDEHLFYAMEFVEGRSLQGELSAGRRFQWREVARMAIDVCRALKHAHDCGVIHRDLKPANLLLDAHEQVKLTDFGIARLFGVSHLTTAGGVMGTADYMSPEQAEGRRVDVRSDLYSLGCVLYALLAGRPPFAADSLAEVLDKLRFAEPVPVGKRAEDVPDELERLISQLLEKDPQHRIPTAVAVAKRLESMLHALTVRPGPADPPAVGAADEGGFVVQDPEAAPDEPPNPVPPIAMLETIGLEPDSPAVQRPPGPGRPTQRRQADAGPPPGEGSNGEKSAVKTSPGRFTTVEEERQRERQDQVSFFRDPVHWLKLAGLLALMGAAIWLVLAALQPPTADQLYQRISAADDEESADSLLAVEDDIQAFLNRFPDDPRESDVRQLEGEIELYRLERQFERQVRRRGTAAELTAVERAYLEAIQYAASSPELAVAKLEALIDVFAAPPNRAGESGQCVELARRQIVRLRGQIDGWSHDHLPTIVAQLDRADALEDTDPAAAESIRRGVVKLYEDKPWAATAVQRARQGLLTSQERARE